MTAAPPAAERTGPGSLDAAVLRIFTPSGHPVGLGFLVTDTLALTCAHVVSSALGIDDDTQPPAGATVVVDLPLLGPGRAEVEAVASIAHWVPGLPSGAGDVAVLRLDAPLRDARPVRLVEAEELWGHPARAYGLPDGRPGGVWHSGTLRHRQANGWVQADLAGSGYPVSRGFSGGPVWDDELAGVIGMVAMTESGHPAACYLIPATSLLTAWPGLRELVLPPSPFRGLRPFQEIDAALFHGRRAESEQVARIVAGERWTTLIGSSGCGKSSLAMAGVVPRRRAAGDCTVVLRPGHHASPLHALAAALLPLLEPELSETQRLAEAPALAEILAEQGLRGIVPRVLDRHHGARLLVVVDQFEELLDLPPGQLEALARILFDDRTPPAVKVLCTLRADFLEPALAHPLLGPVVSKQVCALEPMRPEQLHEIISRPVGEIPGVRYEPNLAERILADAGAEPGALPLLGFTLDLLWERQDKGVLTHHAYEQIGSVAGALGDYAERAWAENVPASDEPSAGRLLTQLVRIPIGTSAPTRRIAPRAELGEQEWRIAQRLAATRLLVLQGSEGTETVELAHEALLTGWDRLARQIAADRSLLDWRESLRHDTDRWHRGGQPRDLLPSRTSLAVARRWLPEHAAELSAAERDYLERGRVHRRVQTRKRRFLVSGLAIVVVAALTFSSLFVYARWQSSEREALANSRALAQHSQDISAHEPALSVMTALAAYQTSPTQEARNQLLRQYLALSDSERVFSGLSGTIAGFHTSRNGDVVLASTDLGRMRLFVHATTGKVRSEPVQAGHVLYTMVSPDGERAGFVNEDGTAGWFEVDADAPDPAGPVHTLPKVTDLSAYYNGPEHSAAMSPDGTLMAVPTRDRLVWWDLDTAAIAGSVPVPPDAGNGLWITPDNRTLLVQTYGLEDPGLPIGLVAVDMATGLSRTVLTPEPNLRFTISGDRTAAVVCRYREGTGSVVRRVRLPEGTEEGRPYSSSSHLCGSNAVDATGQRVVLKDGAVLVVDLDLGTEVSWGNVPPSGTAFASNLISADGKLLLASHGSAKITYTELPPGSRTLEVADQVLTDDGSKTISLLEDGALQLRPAGVDSDRVLAEAPAPAAREDLPDNALYLNRDGSLVANREATNVVVVHETATLRQIARITAAVPPSPPPTAPGDYLHTGRRRPDNNFSFFFGQTGDVVTVSGKQVQQWDARTGRQLAQFDTATLHPGGDADAGVPDVAVGPYPRDNHVHVVIYGDPVVRAVDLSTGHTTATMNVTDDALALQFDRSGRYFALMRQGSVVELWQRDPPARMLGSLPSLSDITGRRWWAGFLDGDGHYMIAANNSIRVYRIGEKAPAESYEFGRPDGARQQSPYTFVNVSKDGRTVLYAGEDGMGGALALDPAAWARDLCRILGHRDLTPEEEVSLPAPVPARQVCP
ncbi:nSTAND1 domain-containing NTPase [Amycolatopsis magusensis]|uniref:Novel STAND NTPase 1 domain-containing protein n=1 Tax=Amycolatopsis magusensis TaxID=882444 RepID=A0ABS4Q356_9PSEU|nr:trypsin-like peptidase domain-containing protein [Amycolatopsis magusensis]MBP2185514.1 hypothetical protein [Amycolatopsis magusensis]